MLEQAKLFAQVPAVFFLLLSLSDLSSWKCEVYDLILMS